MTDIPAYLAKALQLARVKVDGERVGAAVTLMMVPAAAAPPEDPEICVMELDSPSLFVGKDQV